MRIGNAEAEKEVRERKAAHNPASERVEGVRAAALRPAHEEAVAGASLVAEVSHDLRAGVIGGGGLRQSEGLKGGGCGA